MEVDFISPKGREGGSSTPAKRVKRKVEDSNEDNYQPIIVETAAHVKNIVSDIRSFMGDDKNKVNKPSAVYISGKVADLAEVIKRYEISEANLRGKLSVLVELNKAMRQEIELQRLVKDEVIKKTIREEVSKAVKLQGADLPAAPKSYAQVLLAKNPPPPSNVVHIKPVEAEGVTVSSQETEKRVRQVLNPGPNNLKIRAVRKTSTGVIVATHKREDIDKIKEIVSKSGSQLVASEPTKVGPRMIIYNVPKELDTGAKLTETFWEQNSNGISKAKNSFKPLFITGQRGRDVLSWVIEADKEIREKLLGDGMIFLEWNACRVREWLVATRCYKCQVFGHTQKFCKAKSYCGHCAQEGHEFKDCTKKAETPTCINCLRANVKEVCDRAHSANDKVCPAHFRALNRLQQRTKYE